MADDQKRGIPWPMVAGAGVVLLIIGAIWLFTGGKPAQTGLEAKLPFGADEQSYARQIRFEELKVSRAANFLNQEVTFLFGRIVNDGSRKIAGMEVNLEFRDPFGQVVLRDPRPLLGRNAVPIEAGQSREFQISFDHVPADWDQRPPGVRVTGLRLQ